MIIIRLILCLANQAVTLDNAQGTRAKEPIETVLPHNRLIESPNMTNPTGKNNNLHLPRQSTISGANLTSSIIFDTTTSVSTARKKQKIQ